MSYSNRIDATVALRQEGNVPGYRLKTFGLLHRTKKYIAPLTEGDPQPLRLLQT